MKSPGSNPEQRFQELKVKMTMEIKYEDFASAKVTWKNLLKLAKQVRTVEISQQTQLNPSKK